MKNKKDHINEIKKFQTKTNKILISESKKELEIKKNKTNTKTKIEDKTKNIELPKNEKIYKIKHFKFSVKRIRPVLDFIRYKNMFVVLGTLKSSRFSLKVCRELFDFLNISIKHFLSINNMEYNKKNLMNIRLERIYSVQDKKGRYRVSFRGKGRVDYINKTKSHLFCIIKQIKT